MGEAAATIDRKWRATRLEHMGSTLLAEARTMQGRAADAIYRAACLTFEEAVQVEPEMADALVGLGSTRLAQASRTIDRIEREELLGQARRVLLRAEHLWGKAAAYNLACACALDGDYSGCRNWLERAKEELHLPSAEQVFSDPDLEAVRNEPWLAALFPKGARRPATAQLSTLATW